MELVRSTTTASDARAARADAHAPDHAADLAANHAANLGEETALLEALVAAIRSGDAAKMADVFDVIGTAYGTTAGPRVATAVNEAGLADAFISALQNRAQATVDGMVWTQLAAAAGALGRHELALRAANAALMHDPESAGATLLLVAEANRRGDHALARRRLDEWCLRDRQAARYPFVILHRAWADLGEGRARLAIDALQASSEALRAAGLAFDARVMGARAFASMGDTVAAARAWEEAAEVATSATARDLIAPDLFRAQLAAGRIDAAVRVADNALLRAAEPALRTAWLENKAEALERRGDTHGAIVLLNELLADSKEAPRHALLRARQAAIAARAGRRIEAATRFDAALAELEPNAPGAAAGRDADALRQRIRRDKISTLIEHDFDAVRADLAALNSAGPGWPQALDVGAAVLHRQQRPDDALVYLDVTLAARPDLADHPGALQLRAELLLQKGQIEDAVVCARAGADVPAHWQADVRAWFGALQLRMVLQDWPGVFAAAEKMRALDAATADNPAVRLFVANAQLRRGELAAAIASVDAIGVMEAALEPMRLLVRGEALAGLGRHEEAIEAAAAADQALGPDAPLRSMRVGMLMVRTSAQLALGRYADALASADAALAEPRGTRMLDVVRVAARLMRAIAHYRLDNKTAADADLVSAAADYDTLQAGVIGQLVAGNAEVQQIGMTLWLARGAVLSDLSRYEEARAAFARAEALDSGIQASIRKGYMCLALDDPQAALEAFQSALGRARNAAERAEAREGEGRALLRLRRHADAVIALHAALNEQLLAPSGDAGIFEQLGTAYDALERKRAARNAFRRAWDLAPVERRSANLARGVSSSELKLGNAQAALDFLRQDVPAAIGTEPTLLFNRALALDALGRRREALRCLKQAATAGLTRAADELQRLDQPAGLGLWTHHWFGAQAKRVRRAAGVLLVIIAALGMFAPAIEWALKGEVAWFMLLLPSAVALALLALPNLRSISVDLGRLKLTAEPIGASGREGALPKAPAPEDFRVPYLSLALTSVAVGART